MFNSKSKRAKKELEAIFHDIQINLENNYKDLAIGARKKACVRLEELNAAGVLTARDYAALKKRLDEYTRRMEGYHH